MVEYYRSLAAILMIECQQTPPAHQFEPEPDTATTATDGRGKACTARERTIEYVHKTGSDYHGRGPVDVYITAPKLADVLGCSNETARRRLDYFESEGIVNCVSEGRSNHYIVDKKFTAVSDDRVRSAAQITDMAQTALQAAQED
jgi:hypothetical protein